MELEVLAPQRHRWRPWKRNRGIRLRSSQRALYVHAYLLDWREFPVLLHLSRLHHVGHSPGRGSSEPDAYTDPHGDADRHAVAAANRRRTHPGRIAIRRERHH